MGITTKVRTMHTCSDGKIFGNKEEAVLHEIKFLKEQFAIKLANAMDEPDPQSILFILNKPEADAFIHEISMINARYKREFEQNESKSTCDDDE